MLIAPLAVLQRPAFIIPMNDDAEEQALNILRSLRECGIAAEIAYQGNAKKRLERANKSGARFAVLVGEDIKFKNLVDGTQQDVLFSDLPGLMRS